MLSLGKFIFIRTASLIASFLLAGAAVARLGDAPLAAYQVSFQLWIFLALVLDAIAIAGQIIVGQRVGSVSTRGCVCRKCSHDLALFATGAMFAVALLALGGVIPRIFTSDGEVLEQCALLWPVFALMQPLNGIVFALDGILIGASDGRYLALSMVAAFVVCAGALAVATWVDAGVRGVWVALALLIMTRLGLMGARFLVGAGSLRGSRDVRRPEPVRGDSRLREAGTEDVAIGVRGQLVPSLAGLRHDDVATRLSSVSDRAARRAFCPPLPRCSGNVAAKPR